MKRYLLVVLLVVGMVASASQGNAAAITAKATPSASKVPTPAPTPIQRTGFLYSVKFLCGVQQPPTSIKPPQEPPVKAGNYATTINVHNFGLAQVNVCKKAVVAFTELQGPTKLISGFRNFPLTPDGAFYIDCTDIASLFAGVALPPFVEGFVEIRSPVQLNVQTAYTSQTCNTSPTAGGCTSFGALSLEVVPETGFSVAPANAACPLP